MSTLIEFDYAWNVLMAEFAHRFDKAPVIQGPSTARLLRAHLHERPPAWSTQVHDVDLRSVLNAMGDDPLVGALFTLNPVLPWVTRGVFTDSDQTNRGYVEFIGPEGMIRTDRVRLGIYWHAAHTFYPAHRHNATELYHILSGTGFWQHKTQTWTPRGPDSYIMHDSRDNHATRTEAEPTLALWSWLGDIGFESYSMDEAPEGLAQGFVDFPGNLRR